MTCLVARAPPGFGRVRKGEMRNPPGLEFSEGPRRCFALPKSFRGPCCRARFSASLAGRWRDGAAGVLSEVRASAKAIRMAGSCREPNGRREAKRKHADPKADGRDGSGCAVIRGTVAKSADVRPIVCKANRMRSYKGERRGFVLSSLFAHTSYRPYPAGKLSCCGDICDYRAFKKVLCQMPPSPYQPFSCFCGMNEDIFGHVVVFRFGFGWHVARA